MRQRMAGGSHFRQLKPPRCRHGHEFGQCRACAEFCVKQARKLGVLRRFSAQRLKQLRAVMSHGMLSLSDLAQECGVAKSTLSVALKLDQLRELGTLTQFGLSVRAAAAGEG